VKESPGELRTTDLIRLGATTWRRGEEKRRRTLKMHMTNKYKQ
jgi:hypothetical protein